MFVRCSPFRAKFLVSTTSVSPSPVAARVAEPLRNARSRARARVQRNDARVVDHLDLHHHVAGRLQDQVVVVVEPGNHGAGQAAGDAAVVQVHVLPGGRRGDPPRQERVALPLRPRRERGQPAVGRIDDERRLANQVAPLHPELVVAAHVARGRRPVEADLGLDLRVAHRALLPRSASPARPGLPAAPWASSWCSSTCPAGPGRPTACGPGRATGAAPDQSRPAMTGSTASVIRTRELISHLPSFNRTGLRPEPRRPLAPRGSGARCVRLRDRIP